MAFADGGQVAIACSSKFAEDQAGLEREIPRKASGGNVVTTSVSRSATSVNVVNGALFPDPAAVEYRVFLRVKGRQEILECTAVSSNTLTIARAKFGTLGEPLHQGNMLEEIVPLCAANGVDGLPWSDIVIDLLYRGGLAVDDVDSAQITREGLILAGARLKRIIDSESTKSVKSLIDEACDLAMASVFVDESLRVRASIQRPPYPGEGT